MLFNIYFFGYHFWDRVFYYYGFPLRECMRRSILSSLTYQACATPPCFVSCVTAICTQLEFNFWELRLFVCI